METTKKIPTLPRANILLVDDQSENLLALEGVLGALEQNLVTASSGEAALKCLLQQDFAVILLDVQMMGMDGFETASIIRQRNRSRYTPIIFMTAFSQSDTWVFKGYALGAVDYLFKPIKPEILLSKVSVFVELFQKTAEVKRQADQLEALNRDLRQTEASLRQHTNQLQQALEFNSLLKRITDQVRDSLDERQILDTVVQALAEVLGVSRCHAALYDFAQNTATIDHEYTTSFLSTQGQVEQMAESPEIYGQLQQGACFQFCPLISDPLRGQTALLVCAIVNDQDVFGNLCLSSDKDYCFKEIELHLVQQIAGQCAIAMRQARLYEAAQAQVKDLERLNRLKDDFLSTVSHELRTPMSSIKMATHLLEVVLQPLGVLDPDSGQASRYFQILQNECQREIDLINDLLDLSRLEAQVEPLLLTTLVDVRSWVIHLTEPFEARVLSQQQQLKMELPSELPTLTSDLSYLSSILTELLNNACKYTPSGETITIAAHPTTETLQLSVSNSGVEIPPGELEQVFEKFYRVPSHDPWKHGGTGLGLALVRQRTRQIQGTIQATSQSGLTRFTLQLPWHLKQPCSKATIDSICTTTQYNN